MTEADARRRSARLSLITRLVEGTLTELQATASHRPSEGAQVGVVRGFDQGSRDRARLVKRRLGTGGVGTVDILAVPATLTREEATREAESHEARLIDDEAGLAVLVDVTGLAHREAERLAARRGLSLVLPAEQVLADGTLLSHRNDTVSVIITRLGSQNDNRGEHSTTATRWNGDIALESLVLTPHRPAGGQLRFKVGDNPFETLPTGTTLKLGAVAETMWIQAVGGDGVRTWLHRSVEVQPVHGSHTLIRDELPIADIVGPLVIEHHDAGLRRRLV